MDVKLLQKHFGWMGARLEVSQITRRRWGNAGRPGLDVGADKHGQLFIMRLDPQEQVDYEVVNIRPDIQHLLLMARQNGEKHKFLCGQDERHLFVCAVPGRGVTDVRSAMEALQPPEVKQAVAEKVRHTRQRLQRRNDAFLRQGEWFFLAAPELVVDPKNIQRREPLSNGRGRAHWCDEVFRVGGTEVFVSAEHPAGLNKAEYEELLRTTPRAKSYRWRRMTRTATVYARGKVRHPDHHTLWLDGWHRVLMNTEYLAPGAQSVVFLD
jgi:hypothetical protein